jgi:hypothetical protein
VALARGSALRVNPCVWVWPATVRRTE